MIPISKDILQPTPISKTNILYVDSLEEFEKIELQPNETKIAFDRSKDKQVFYVRERDKYGEYSPVMIYFYRNFAQQVQDFEREEFIKKCKEIGLDDLKIQLACMFFLENKKPLEVWEWTLKNTKKDWSWDYVKNLKSNLKKKLAIEIIKK